jgi:hypothetical protein
MQLHVMCNLSYVTTQTCSYMCPMQLNFSCKRQLQNLEFLVVLDGPADSANNCNASLPKRRLCTCCCLLYGSLFWTQTIILLLWHFRWPDQLYKQFQCIIVKRKVVHVLLFVVWFAILDVDDYFTLVAF